MKKIKSLYIPQKKYLFLLWMIAFISPRVLAQPGPSEPMSLIIQGGNQTLTINSGVAGGTLKSEINTNSTLEYDTGNRNRKITVSTSCPDQSFTLTVVAIDVTEGVAQNPVTLIDGNPAIDFIRNIKKRNNNETCTLSYTASATFDQGNSNDEGNDVHVVRYTIQQQ